MKKLAINLVATNKGTKVTALKKLAAQTFKKTSLITTLTFFFAVSTLAQNPTPQKTDSLKIQQTTHAAVRQNAAVIKMFIPQNNEIRSTQNFSYDQNTQQTEDKNALQEMIKNIQSIKFDKETEVKTDAILKNVGKTPQKNNNHKKTPTTIKKETVQKPQPEKVKPLNTTPKKLKQNISDQTLDSIKRICEHPESIQNPFALAEILFKCCQNDMAAVYYIAAEDQKNISQDDKAWAMFQAANCLAQNKPENALKKYETLLQKYPQSPWTQIANSKISLLKWKIENTPQTLIENVSSEIKNGGEK